MKARMLVGVAMGSGSLIVCSQARAEYTGLTALYEDNDGAGHDIYRVYAEFTNANDGVVICNGNSANPIHIQTRLADDSGIGSEFYNPGGPHANLAPSDGIEVFGCYVTIGLDHPIPISGTSSSPYDATGLTPGFPNFIDGNEIASSNIGWYVAGAVPQAFASFIVSGNDTSTRVMIMQLAVNQGEHVQGTLNIGVIEDGVINPNLILGQTFFGVPGPGGVVPFAITGVCMRKRGRNSR